MLLMSDQAPMDYTRDQIEAEVRRILRDASRGKGPEPWFLTAYQILARFPPEMRTWLIYTHGKPGQGAGQHTSAALHIARIAAKLCGEDNKAYLDTGDLFFDIGTASGPIRAGYELCALFRLPTAD